MGGRGVEGPAVRRVTQLTDRSTVLQQHRTVEHRYYVYILASKSRALYIGVTRNLTARILQHRSGEFSGFTNDYNVHRLAYYEQHAWTENAIAREKQLKRWRREKKVWLIERENPTWEDLAADWGKPVKLTRRDPSIPTDSRSLHYAPARLATEASREEGGRSGRDDT